jgi:restriction system protein
MAVPTFEYITQPFLLELSDGREHTLKELIERIAVRLKLSEEDRRQMLPSGNQAAFVNRVGWARTYLKKAGLIESPKRALFHLTQRGKDVLQSGVSKIDVEYLKRFPEFMEFHTVKKEDGEPVAQPLAQNSQTPEEVLESAYEQIRSTLAQELLSKVLLLSWMDFERLVVQLLVQMGYGGSVKDAGKALAKGGDEGIDGTIKEDKLGLDIIYIQAKKWQPGNVVGRPEIQKFVGALAGQGAKKGIFITTSSFTKEAQAYMPRNETKIVLLDGEQLAQLMIDHNLGVTHQQTYEVKRLDSDFFGEE